MMRFVASEPIPDYAGGGRLAIEVDWSDEDAATAFTAAELMQMFLNDWAMAGDEGDARAAVGCIERLVGIRNWRQLRLKAGDAD